MLELSLPSWLLVSLAFFVDWSHKGLYWTRVGPLEIAIKFFTDCSSFNSLEAPLRTSKQGVYNQMGTGFQTLRWIQLLANED